MLRRALFASLLLLIAGNLPAQQPASPAPTSGAASKELSVVPPRNANAQNSLSPINHANQVKVIVASADKSSDKVIAIPPDTSWTASMEMKAEKPANVLNSSTVAEWLHTEPALNGLQSLGIHPWHVVIVYDQFDEDGDNVHSGVVEEFWENPKRYSISYKSDALTQTDYATEQGLFRLGDQRWPTPAEMQVRVEIVDPFFYAATLQDFSTSSEERTFGSHSLHCVVLKKAGGISVPTQYCFDHDGTTLRYTRGQGWFQTVYNDIVQFDGRSIAQEVEVTNGGKPFLKLHVKTIEMIPQIDEKNFTPPADAVNLIGKRVTGVPRQPVQMSFPEWPTNLQRQHFVVTAQIVIGKDGHVISAQAVSGPSDAYKAAEKALRKWIFQPYLVLGEPAEVETKVSLSNN